LKWRNSTLLQYCVNGTVWCGGQPPIFHLDGDVEVVSLYRDSLNISGKEGLGYRIGVRSGLVTIVFFSFGQTLRST
jgi:hypothetical protein